MTRLSPVLALLACGACAGGSPATLVSPSPVAPTISTPQITTETWIISGQSNAVGCALGTGPSPLPSVVAAPDWLPAADPLRFLDHTGCEGPVGPWVTAGQQVATRTGRVIRLNGWARGGLPIAQWAETGDAWAGLAPTLAEADRFFWYQGETDAVTGHAADYAPALRDLLARVRRLTRPTLPVVIIGLADAPVGSGWSESYAAVRSAQQTVARDDPFAQYVTAEGLPLDVPPHHLSAEGFAQLAARIADAVR